MMPLVTTVSQLVWNLLFPMKQMSNLCWNLSCCLCLHLINFLSLAYRIADGWKMSVPIHVFQCNEIRHDFS